MASGAKSKSGISVGGFFAVVIFAAIIGSINFLWNAYQQYDRYASQEMDYVLF
jgi:hypothetical protein